MTETDQPDEVGEAAGEPGLAAEDLNLQVEMDALIEGAAGLLGNLKEIFLKGKDEVARGAQLGKVRIDVFQLRQDRDQLLQRLGEGTYELMLRDEITHADLDKPFGKIKDLDERLQAVEAEIADLVVSQETAKPAANEGEAAVDTDGGPDDEAEGPEVAGESG